MLVGCPPWKEEVTAETAEGGLSVAASGAEAVTAEVSEEVEEATGEDTALERWMQGATAGRSVEAARTEPSSEDKLFHLGTKIPHLSPFL